jgi:hypothetical protein
MSIPLDVVETGQPSSWITLERDIGLVFPQDYKWFINNFGTGVICNELWVLNPFSGNVNLNFDVCR